LVQILNKSRTMIHASLDAHLNVISDPRKNNWLKRYELRDILIIAVCATIGGADGFTEISDFGKQHIDWFRKFLILPHGIPSHDTFNRVFSLLDPAEFNRCFVEWMGSACDMAKGEIVPIDGKTIKGSKSSTESALHIVSAWSSKNKLVLGQLATDKKSNEITAIPKLLDMLEISNCIVTTDAMGCQKAIAKKIVGKNANYVLGLKGNQGKLHKEIVQEFGDQTIDSLTQNTDDYFESVDGDHGRIETRRFWSVP
jgi:predicted transposase YbfD/YdcC